MLNNLRADPCRDHLAPLGERTTDTEMTCLSSSEHEKVFKRKPVNGFLLVTGRACISRLQPQRVSAKINMCRRPCHTDLFIGFLKAVLNVYTNKGDGKWDF